jgi:hypothetical protein
MPGFGHGPFGHGPFGQWDWSRTVLYRQLPDPDLDADADQGFILAHFMEALRPLLDKSRLGIRDWLAQADPLRARSYDTGERYIRLGPQVVELGPIEQQGVDGAVLTEGGFQALSGRFTADDVNKLLVLRGSAVPTNNRSFKIISVVSASLVVTLPATQLDAAGSIRWTLQAEQSVRAGVISVQVVEGDLQGVAGSWVLDDGAAQYPVQARHRFRRAEQGERIFDFSSAQGFTSAGTVVVADGAFTARDVGKPILLGREQDHAVEPQYAVRRILSMTQIELMAIGGGAPVVPPAALEQPYDVLMMPHGLLDLEASTPPVGTALQGGVDLEVLGIDIVTAVSGDFSPATLLGLNLEIRGSQVGNDGVYTIVAIQPGNILKLGAALSTESGLVWYLRAKTALGDSGQVRLRQQSLLRLLAANVGLELDTQESTARQRAWVNSISQWYDIKGLGKAYEILGTVAGFDIVASQLWAVSHEYAIGLPAENLYEAGEPGDAGRRGTDGAVVADVLGGFVDAPTALFTPGDVGLFIRISGAATGGNNQRYLVLEYISPTRVRVSNFTPVVATDANNGALSWYVLRLYTDLAPKRPRMDDMDVDALAEIIETESGGTLHFGMDYYCWEADFSTAVPLAITAAQFISRNRWRLTIESATVAPFPAAPEVISTPGPEWLLEDSLGAEYVVETRPVGGPPSYTVEVVSRVQPALGAATLRYDCPVVPSCGHCAASAVLIKIGFGSIANEAGLAIEKATERLLRRLNEVRPLHVRLIVLLGATLRASLTLSARIDTSVTTGAALYAPLTAYFDDVALDDMALDSHMLLARISTP